MKKGIIYFLFVILLTGMNVFSGKAQSGYTITAPAQSSQNEKSAGEIYRVVGKYKSSSYPTDDWQQITIKVKVIQGMFGEEISILSYQEYDRWQDLMYPSKAEKVGDYDPLHNYYKYSGTVVTKKVYFNL